MYTNILKNVLLQKERNQELFEEMPFVSDSSAYTSITCKISNIEIMSKIFNERTENVI